MSKRGRPHVCKDNIHPFHCNQCRLRLRVEINGRYGNPASRTRGRGREYGDKLKALRRVSICAQHLRVRSAELDFGGVRSDHVLFQSAHPHVWPSARVPTSLTHYSTSVVLVYPISTYSCPTTGAYLRVNYQSAVTSIETRSLPWACHSVQKFAPNRLHMIQSVPCAVRLFGPSQRIAAQHSVSRR